MYPTASPTAAPTMYPTEAPTPKPTASVPRRLGLAEVDATAEMDMAQSGTSPPLPRPGLTKQLKSWSLPRRLQGSEYFTGPGEVKFEIVAKVQVPLHAYLLTTLSNASQFEETLEYTLKRALEKTANESAIRELHSFGMTWLSRQDAHKVPGRFTVDLPDASTAASFAADPEVAGHAQLLVAHSLAFMDAQPAKVYLENMTTAASLRRRLAQHHQDEHHDGGGRMLQAPVVIGQNQVQVNYHVVTPIGQSTHPTFHTVEAAMVDNADMLQHLQSLNGKYQLQNINMDYVRIARTVCKWQEAPLSSFLPADAFFPSAVVGLSTTYRYWPESELISDCPHPAINGTTCFLVCAAGYKASGSLMCTSRGIVPFDPPEQSSGEFFGCMPEPLCEFGVLPEASFGDMYATIMTREGAVAMELLDSADSKPGWMELAHAHGAEHDLYCPRPRAVHRDWLSLHPGVTSQKLSCRGGEWWITVGDSSVERLLYMENTLYCQEQLCPASSAQLPEGSTLACMGGAEGEALVAEGLSVMGTSCNIVCNAVGMVLEPLDAEYRCVYVQPSSLTTSGPASEEDIVWDPDMAGPNYTASFARVRNTDLGPGLMTDMPACVPIPCEIPELYFVPFTYPGSPPLEVREDMLEEMAVNNILNIDCTGLTYGNTCQPVCSYGYEPDTSQELVCRESGIFAGNVACKLTTCDAEPVWAFGETGFVASDCAGRSHGEVCMATCATGYESFGPVEYHCEMGEWMFFSETEPPCEPLACQNPPAVPGAVDSPNGTCAGMAHGSICGTTCPEGYEIESEVLCQLGKFRVPNFGCISLAAAAETESISTALSFSMRMVMGEDTGGGGAEQTTRGKAASSIRDLASANPDTSAVQLGQQIAREMEAEVGKEKMALTLLDGALSAGLPIEKAVQSSVAAALAVRPTTASIAAAGTGGAEGDAPVEQSPEEFLQTAVRQVADLAMQRGGEADAVMLAVVDTLVDQAVSLPELVTSVKSAVDATGTRVVLPNLAGRGAGEAVGRRLEEKASYNAEELGSMAGKISSSLFKNLEVQLWDLRQIATKAREAVWISGKSHKDAEIAAAIAAARVLGTTDATLGNVWRRWFELAGNVGEGSRLENFVASARTALAGIASEMASSSQLAVGQTAYASGLAHGLASVDAASFALGVVKQMLCPEYTGPDAENAAEKCSEQDLAVIARAAGQSIFIMGGQPRQAAEAARAGMIYFAGMNAGHALPLMRAVAWATVYFGQGAAAHLVGPVLAEISGEASTTSVQRSYDRVLIEASVRAAMSQPQLVQAAQQMVARNSNKSAILTAAAVAGKLGSKASPQEAADSAFAAVIFNSDLAKRTEAEVDAAARVYAKATAAAVAAWGLQSGVVSTATLSVALTAAQVAVSEMQARWGKDLVLSALPGPIVPDSSKSGWDAMGPAGQQTFVSVAQRIKAALAESSHAARAIATFSASLQVGLEEWQASVVTAMVVSPQHPWSTSGARMAEEGASIKPGERDAAQRVATAVSSYVEGKNPETSIIEAAALALGLAETIHLSVEEIVEAVTLAALQRATQVNPTRVGRLGYLDVVSRLVAPLIAGTSRTPQHLAGALVAWQTGPENAGEKQHKLWAASSAVNTALAAMGAATHIPRVQTAANAAAVTASRLRGQDWRRSMMMLAYGSEHLACGSATAAMATQASGAWDDEGRQIQAVIEACAAVAAAQGGHAAAVAFDAVGFNLELGVAAAARAAAGAADIQEEHWQTASEKVIGPAMLAVQRHIRPPKFPSGPSDMALLAAQAVSSSTAAAAGKTGDACAGFGSETLWDSCEKHAIAEGSSSPYPYDDYSPEPKPADPKTPISTNTTTEGEEGGKRRLAGSSALQGRSGQPRRQVGAWPSVQGSCVRHFNTSQQSCDRFCRSRSQNALFPQVCVQSEPVSVHCGQRELQPWQAEVLERDGFCQTSNEDAGFRPGTVCECSGDAHGAKMNIANAFEYGRLLEEARAIFEVSISVSDFVGVPANLMMSVNVSSSNTPDEAAAAVKAAAKSLDLKVTAAHAQFVAYRAALSAGMSRRDAAVAAALARVSYGSPKVKAVISTVPLILAPPFDLTRGMDEEVTDVWAAHEVAIHVAGEILPDTSPSEPVVSAGVVAEGMQNGFLRTAARALVLEAAQSADAAHKHGGRTLAQRWLAQGMSAEVLGQRFGELLARGEAEGQVLTLEATCGLMFVNTWAAGASLEEALAATLQGSKHSQTFQPEAAVKFMARLAFAHGASTLEQARQALEESLNWATGGDAYSNATRRLSNATKEGASAPFADSPYPLQGVVLGDVARAVATEEEEVRILLGVGSQFQWNPLPAEWVNPEPEGATKPSSGGSSVSRDFAWQYREVFGIGLATAINIKPEQVLIVGVSALGGGRRLLGGSMKAELSVARPRGSIVARKASLSQGVSDAGVMVRRTQSDDMANLVDGIELDFVIDVRPGDSVAALENKLTQFSNKSSDVYKSFMTATLTEFERRGVEVPSSLRTATLGTTKPLQVQNIQTPVSKWLAFPWSWCSNACGTGNRTRKVECSTGNTVACTIHGAEPVMEEVCEDFDACAYNPMCPLGQGAGMNCETQASIVMGSFVIPVGLFALCVLRAFQVKLRRPLEGEALVKNAPKEFGKVAWNRTSTTASKTQITWDLFHEDLKDKVEEVLRLEEEPVLALAKITVEDNDAFSVMLDNNLDIVDLSPQSYHWMYDVNQRMEYYSLTHHMWLTGKISNVDVTAIPMPTVIYDVTLLPSQQVRTCCPLETIRPTFAEDEPCSFFSTRDDCWLPAAVYGKQSYACTSVGYRIKLAGGARDLLCPVPASRLRKRFPAGSFVEVFLDPREGWLRAMVVQERLIENVERLRAQWEAVLDGHLNESNPSRKNNWELESDNGSVISVGTVISGLSATSWHTGHDQRPPTPRSAAASQRAPTREDGETELCRWSLVELTLNDSGESKIVPSFMLRHTAEALQEMSRRRAEEDKLRQEADARRQQQYRASEQLALAGPAGAEV
eukprot:TRINITY_DN32367_c0_g1_i2.p1 TRINITY_DN32367_c0_g1~~TRINITY_DN32367_c0_g1_i2.p1  ORF type:complete len:3013 (+),score=569.42 TRINITY_DN32367_c0_g1_i2:2-9040(+)